MKNIYFATLALIVLQACSVVQATSGPEQKDLSVFERGTNRDYVLAEFGQPTVTATDFNGNTYDIFRFHQGQHGGVKAGKAVAYGTLALFTLGLSEVVTSPLEGANKGAEMKIKVTYSDDERVNNVNVFQDDRWFPIQDITEDVPEEE
ncbi:MAG: hypothetical protein ABJ308_05340 [Halieaceae bacterium]